MKSISYKLKVYSIHKHVLYHLEISDMFLTLVSVFKVISERHITFPFDTERFAKEWFIPMLCEHLMRLESMIEFKNLKAAMHLSKYTKLPLLLSDLIRLYRYVMKRKYVVLFTDHIIEMVALRMNNIKLK